RNTHGFVEAENTGFDKPMKFNQPSSVSERLAADLLFGWQRRGWDGVFEVWEFVEIVDDAFKRFYVAEFGVHVEDVVRSYAWHAVTYSLCDYDWPETFSYGIFYSVAYTCCCGNAGDNEGVDAIRGEELIEVGAWECRSTYFLDNQFAF